MAFTEVVLSIAGIVIVLIDAKRKNVHRTTNF